MKAVDGVDSRRRRWPSLLCGAAFGALALVAIAPASADAGTPQISITPQSAHAGDPVAVQLTGFAPNAQLKVTDTTGIVFGTATTDATGSASGTLRYGTGHTAGARQVCATAAGGQQACADFNLLAGEATPASTAPSSATRQVDLRDLGADAATGLIYLLLLAVFAVTVRPAIRTFPRLGARRRLAGPRSVLGYVLLAVSAVLAPLLAWAALLTVMLRGSSVVRSAIPLLRETSRSVRAVGWTLWYATVFLCALLTAGITALPFLAATTPNPADELAVLVILNAVVGAPIALFGMVLAVWMVAEDTLRRRQVADFIVLCVAPLVGIGRTQIVRPGNATTHPLWLIVSACWLSVYTAIVAVAAITLLYGAATWSDWTSMAMRYVLVSAMLGAVTLTVRGGYLTTVGQPALAHDAHESATVEPLDEPATPPSRWRGLALPILVLGGWSLFVMLAAWPWGMIDISHLQHDRTPGLRPHLLFVVVAGVPVAIVSLLGLTRRIRPGRAVAGAVIVAVVLTFTGSLAELNVDPRLGVLIEGLCVGLSTGVSVGLAQQFRLRRRMAELPSWIAATGFCMLMTYLLIAQTVADWPLHRALPSTDWITIMAAGMLGLGLGFVVGDVLLLPGLFAFSITVRYLQELSWPLVGFAAGYAFIVLGFAGGYYAIYRNDMSAQPAPTSYQSSATVQASPTACDVTVTANFTHAPGSDMKLCGLIFDDFAYFSMNTVAPLGYSDVRPKSEGLRAMTAAELAMGIIWTVVVFGLLLAHLTDDHVRRIVVDVTRRV